MKRVFLAGLCLASLSAVGCGDNLVTAAQKVANGQICQLSANEVLALNDAAISVGASQTPPVTIPRLTADQAAALSKFAADNSLCTQQDFENLESRIQNGPPLVGLDELAAAFGDIDPENIDADELAMIFNQYIGG